MKARLHRGALAFVVVVHRVESDADVERVTGFPLDVHAASARRLDPARYLQSVAVVCDLILDFHDPRFSQVLLYRPLSSL